MLGLLIREDFKCWICGGEIPLDYELGAPNAPSKDHFIPRSVFKSNLSELTDDFFSNNIRLAHRHCNSERKSSDVHEHEAELYRVKLEVAQELWDIEH